MTERIIPADYPYARGRYCIDGRYFVHEGSPTSAGNLAWFLRQFCADDRQRYAQFNARVAERREQPSGLLFLPYLYGSNLGGNTPGGLIGLSAHHEMADVVQAIYQGIVFSHLIHQERMVQLNPRIERVRMTGGPTQSEVWMQMYADAGNLPLEVVETRQSGCRAAALCAAVGAGEYAGFAEAIAAAPPKLRCYYPATAAHRRLRAQQARYLAVAQALSEVTDANH